MSAFINVLSSFGHHYTVSSNSALNSKKCWVVSTPNLGQIWTNPNVELKI